MKEENPMIVKELHGANNNGGNASSQSDIKLKEYQQTFCREYHIR